MIFEPTHCPSCNHPVVKVKDQLFCKNSECGSIILKKLEHFCKTIKIKGLGPANLKKLDFASITDLYTTSLEEYINKLGSEKIAEKIFAEIEYSKQLSLNDLLPAFSIPLIGKSATDKISKVCENIFDINTNTCKSAGIGPKATENLIQWIDSNFNLIEALPFTFEFTTNAISQQNDKVICITGKLNSFKTKEEAYVKLREFGFVIKERVTKEVNFLVNESGKETSKTQKARESGVTIIENLSKFIGDN